MAGTGEPSPLPDWVRSLIFDTDVSFVTGQIVEGVFAGPFAEHRNDATLVEVFQPSVHSNVEGFRRFIAEGISIDDAIPSRPLKLAAIQAQLRISETAIQSAYRIGSQVLLGYWVGEIGRKSEENGIPREELLTGIVALLAWFFEYQDNLLARISSAYGTELEALRASKADLRRQLLRAYLAGESTLGQTELTDALQHPVGEDHLAIILTGVFEGGAGRVTKVLHAAGGPVSMLLYPVSLDKLAIWASKSAGWPVRTIDRLQRELAGAGLTASIGGPGGGPEGLRSSYEEATALETVRGALGEEAPRVMVFADFRLEAFALVDPQAARRFVGAELGELADDSEVSARLRETLLAWFVTGSHVSTAAQLGLHEHTVRNRIRKAEEVVGHPLTVRRTELQVGLRLHQIVGLRSSAPAEPGRDGGPAD